MRNLHLIISVLIIIPAAFMYGLNPRAILPMVLDISIDTVDIKNVFRALMCLYLGIAGIWILGIARPAYWEFSTLLVIVFMGSLGLGRILSLFADGSPSLLFVFGLVGELLLAVFAMLQLRKYR